MTTNLNTRSLQRGTTTFLIVLALVTSAALLTGCSGDIPVAPDETSTETAAADMASPMTAKGGLTMLSFPEDFPGPPQYASGHGKNAASLGFGGLLTDGEWVAVELVRDPECVPDDYNLLSPIPNIPFVFGCALTIEGKTWFSDPSNPAAPPVKAWHDGLGAVPIYFAHLSEYEAAVADDVLTIVEFEDLSSLIIGYASYHREVLQFPLNGRPGSANIVSRGELEDGRSFQVNGTVVGTEGHATIRFD
jgi:hypothetical protein